MSAASHGRRGRHGARGAIVGQAISERGRARSPESDKVKAGTPCEIGDVDHRDKRAIGVEYERPRVPSDIILASNG